MDPRQADRREIEAVEDSTDERRRGGQPQQWHECFGAALLPPARRRSRGLDPERGQSERLPQQRLLDAYGLDPAQRHAPLAPGQQPVPLAQLAARALEREAVVADHGSDHGERPADDQQ